MANRNLTQVSTLTDFDYLLLVKGTEVAKITKAQAASVLAGLLPVVSSTKDGLAWKGGFLHRERIDAGDSVDNYTNPGMYGLNGCNAPYDYGGMIVFNPNVLVVQIVFSMIASNRPYYRVRWNNGAWQSWVQL